MKTILALLFSLISFQAFAALPTAIGGAVSAEADGDIVWPDNFFAMNLIAGSGVTLTPNGKKLTIAASGGGGSMPSTSAGVASAVSDETGSGLMVFGTSPTLATPTINGAAAWQGGVRQTFGANASVPGLNVGSVAGDPSSTSNGDVWANSTAGRLRTKVGSQTADIATGYQYEFSIGTVSSATAIVIDFSLAQYQKVTLTHNATLATANRSATAGRSVTMFFTASGATRTVTVNGSWFNYGTDTVLSIPAGKDGFVTVFSLGAAETDVRVASGVSQ